VLPALPAGAASPVITVHPGRADDHDRAAPVLPGHAACPGAIPISDAHTVVRLATVDPAFRQ